MIRRPAVHRLIFAGFPILVAAVAACTPAQPCDPGQIFEFDAVCVAADASFTLPDGGGPGDGGDVPGTDAGPACTLPLGGFGVSCTEQSQCACGLDYCRTDNGADYCTQTGCKDGPTLCPAGWTCTDLSILSPGMPSICTRPS